MYFTMFYRFPGDKSNFSPVRCYRLSVLIYTLLCCCHLNCAKAATTDAALSLLQESRSSEEVEDSTSFKGWSGVRISKNSLAMVYYHDLTIAVVEIGAGRILMNCELIEVFNDKQASDVLHQLSKILNRPFRLKFNDMIDLMSQCDKLDSDRIKKLANFPALKAPSDNNEISTTPNTIMSGILPGTKWCGKGDIADNYFDLGTEKNIDMCCRRHDLCPTKIMGEKTRYNLTNKSKYTKSHCHCDNEFSKCLKTCNRSLADLMGNIYFNILRIACVEDNKDSKGKHFRNPHPY